MASVSKGYVSLYLLPGLDNDSNICYHNFRKRVQKYLSLTSCHISKETVPGDPLNHPSERQHFADIQSGPACA